MDNRLKSRGFPANLKRRHAASAMASGTFSFFEAARRVRFDIVERIAGLEDRDPVSAGLLRRFEAFYSGWPAIDTLQVNARAESFATGLIFS